MPQSAKPTGLALHLHIASLFFILIITSGLVLSLYHYHQQSKLIINAAQQLFATLSHELSENMEDNQRSLNTSLHILARTKLATGTTLAERKQALPMLWQTLHLYPNMNAVYAGYPNNDFFYLGKYLNNHKVRHPRAPAATQFLLTTVEHLQGQAKVSHSYLDEQGNTLLSVADEQYTLMATRRPWYQEADGNKEIVTTKPYIFYDLNRLGITKALQANKQQAVVAFDYTLSALSHALAKMQRSPDSQVVIFNDEHQVVAYQDASKLLKSDQQSQRLMSLSELQVPVLEDLVNRFPLTQQALRFRFDHQEWIGQISDLRLSQQHGFYLVILEPMKTLLSSAYQTRKESVWITLVILIITLPFAWALSQLISKPLRHLSKDLEHIESFDFTHPIKEASVVKEVSELATMTASMKTTIAQFQQLSASLMAQKSLTSLLAIVCQESIAMAKVKAGIVYLYDEKQQDYVLAHSHIDRLSEAQNQQHLNQLKQQPIALQRSQAIFDSALGCASETIALDKSHPSLGPWLQDLTQSSELTRTWVKLKNHNNQVIGLMVLLDETDSCAAQLAFVQALADFAAMAIEGQQLLQQQKALLDSFIALIAGAIDSKSPYTGGHCARVPELTKMLTKAACDDQHNYANFDLNEEQWEELHIAAWLHDCGKIITPEHVVDKATKLETVYDRIHEVRMRFELLKQQAHSDYWQGVAEGGDAQTLSQQRDALLSTLDEEFAFVAECNIGGEFMDQAKLDKIKQIAQRTWTRTLDDRLGISLMETHKLQPYPAANLPTQEFLLADKAHHLRAREQAPATAPNNPWGFNMVAPEYELNLGEIYNLSVQKGTLTNEERYTINAHIVHTIVMLSQLPLPRQLQQVPTIAGSHHEKMDGTGYPRGIPAADLPLTARVMVIADIFEALTAADRPYKDAKTLSEAVKIMSFMAKEQHIDPDLFKLFLRSGVYLQYGQQFLTPEQIDDVDIASYLND